MSNVNITVKHSEVERKNLVIYSGSSVEGQNLILDDGENYVERYSPSFLKDNFSMKALYGRERDEIDELYSNIIKEYNNCFFKNLNFNGIQKWERVFGLESNSSFDLNTRKELLLTKRRFRPPFTRQNLQRILESVWGDGNYTFEIYPNEFQMTIDIHTNYPEVYLKFQQYIRNLIPANMYVIFAIQYTYLYLYRNYTYNNMSALTYAELSKYSKRILELNNEG